MKPVPRHWSAINGFAWALLIEHRKRLALLSVVVFSSLCILTLLLPAVDHAARLKLLKSSSLTFSTLMAILMGILLSARSIPRDEEEHYTYAFLSKPVSRADLVIGKAVGASILAGMMILIASVITYIFLLIANSGHQQEAETGELMGAHNPLAVRETIGAKRRASKTSPPLSAIALGAVGLALQEYTSSSLQGLFEGESLTWKFHKLNVAELGSNPHLLLRTQVFGKKSRVNRVWVSGGAATMGLGSLGGATAPQYKARSKSIFLAVRYQCGNKDIRRLVMARTKEGMVIPLPKALFSEASKGPIDLDVSVINMDSAMIALFNDSKDRSGEELYGVGISKPDQSFAQNLFSAYFLLWLRVSILIAFATAASTCTSAWTAAFITLLFSIVGSSVPFMTEFGAKLGQAQAIHNHDGHDHHNDEEHGETSPSIVHTSSGQVLKLMVKVVPDLSLYDSIPFIMKGQKIPVHVLVRQSGVFLLNSIVLLIIGCLIFHSREFA
jgi:hypothetical protein